MFLPVLMIGGKCFCFRAKAAHISGHLPSESGSFQAFAGASPKYLGAREGDVMKKRGGERKKSDSRCHARLCERADSLKALGSVAGYTRKMRVAELES